MLQPFKKLISLLKLKRASYMPSLWQLYRASGGDDHIIYDTQQIIQTIDREKFDKIYQTFKDFDPYPGASKYLDTSTHLARAIAHCHRLGLHQSTPCKILDLGSGPGYFPYACQYYGHHAEALDVDWTDMYNQMKQDLRLIHHVWQITAFQALPANLGTFDYITAFQIMFDRRDNKIWTVKEWQFFLQSLQPHLNTNGRVFLGLNTLLADERPIFEENMQFFQNHGAIVQNYNVMFSNLSQF